MTINRIVWHHSAGTYDPSGLDRSHYHRLVDGDGRVHAGMHPIADNAAGRRLVSGHYAAHTRALNSGAIGLAICAMASAEWARPFAGRYPVRPVQVDALITETAELCRRYGIAPDRRFTLSHAEVEPTLGVWQRGKWDFDYPPRGGPGARDPVAVGDELRADLARALGRTALDRDVAAAATAHPTIGQGATGDAVRELQRLLGGLTADGIFGPKTRAAVIKFQRSRQLLPDGIVGPMTWAALAT